jgi:hypothetical protein
MVGFLSFVFLDLGGREALARKHHNLTVIDIVQCEGVSRTGDED